MSLNSIKRIFAYYHKHAYSLLCFSVSVLVLVSVDDSNGKKLECELRSIDRNRHLCHHSIRIPYFGMRGGEIQNSEATNEYNGSSNAGYNDRKGGYYNNLEANGINNRHVVKKKLDIDKKQWSKYHRESTENDTSNDGIEEDESSVTAQILSKNSAECYHNGSIAVTDHQGNNNVFASYRESHNNFVNAFNHCAESTEKHDTSIASTKNGPKKLDHVDLKPDKKNYKNSVEDVSNERGRYSNHNTLMLAKNLDQIDDRVSISKCDSDSSHRYNVETVEVNEDGNTAEFFHLRSEISNTSDYGNIVEKCTKYSNVSTSIEFSNRQITSNATVGNAFQYMQSDDDEIYFDRLDENYTYDDNFHPNGINKSFATKNNTDTIYTSRKDFEEFETKSYFEDIHDEMHLLESFVSQFKNNKDNNVNFVITRRMRKVLMNDLGYSSVDVTRMRPGIAALVIDKKLQRPLSGMPNDWIDQQGKVADCAKYDMASSIRKVLKKVFIKSLLALISSVVLMEIFSTNNEASLGRKSFAFNCTEEKLSPPDISCEVTDEKVFKTSTKRLINEDEEQILVDDISGNSCNHQQQYYQDLDKTWLDKLFTRVLDSVTKSKH